MKRLGTMFAAALVAVVLVAGCILPLSTAGTTGQIDPVSTATFGGWKYDFFRNRAYPCSVSGYQTFVVGTKVGSSTTTTAPLYAYMHGGGFGYFDATGHPIPSTGQKVEESAASLNPLLTVNGLVGSVRASPAGFRTLAVSYCSHDLYAGMLSTDPHNPNLDANGKPRTTNGVLEVKAAVQFVQSKYPTSKFFLYGGSAGSAGTYGVAWAQQEGGNAPAGILADASVANLEAFQVAFDAGICTDKNNPANTAALTARVHPDLGSLANEPDKLVSSGRLTVPILHIWNHGDANTCGSAPVACPLRNGSTVTMGYTDCIHEPMRLAIAAQGPSSRSKNLPVCVDNDAVADCSLHVVMGANLVNTDPASPADYVGAAMAWVNARLADA